MFVNEGDVSRRARALSPRVAEATARWKVSRGIAVRHLVLLTAAVATPLLWQVLSSWGWETWWMSDLVDRWGLIATLVSWFSVMALSVFIVARQTHRDCLANFSVGTWGVTWRALLAGALWAAVGFGYVVISLATHESPEQLSGGGMHGEAAFGMFMVIAVPIATALTSALITSFVVVTTHVIARRREMRSLKVEPE